MNVCYNPRGAPKDDPRRQTSGIPRFRRVPVNSEISEDEDAPIAVGDALQTLEEIMADENSLWTKIIQPRLNELQVVPA